MKRTHTILIAALAGIALSLFASSAQAQYKPTGDDGITASPKVRAQLDARNARLNTASATVASMPCPKCKDEWVSARLAHFKGAEAFLAGGPPTRKVARHLCAGCESTIKTVGLSKQTAHNVVVHQCTACGSENLACCSARSSSDVATRGMDKNFQIAPLK